MTHGAPIDLRGTWRALPSTPDLAKSFAGPEFDDVGWAELPVPGHWRSHPSFATCDGPVLYRRAFAAERAPRGTRAFLELEGAFYFTDVWLDAEYLGAGEGFFAPHAFDVTEQVAAREEHLIAIEVACPPAHDRAAKRTITGVFSHWDTIDRTSNPGGLWRPVRVTRTGPVRIARCRVVCTESGPEHGRLLADLTLDNAGAEPVERVRLVGRVLGPGGELLAEQRLDRTIAEGDNHLSIPLDVDNPPRWWPRRLGEQPLCTVEVTVEAAGLVSDARQVRTAFRDVRLDDWIFTINGERLFVMGSNHGPTLLALGEATTEELRRDVQLAIDANLDLLRVHAHVSRPELYEAADELGLLLWQDFPLQWGYARSIRKQAAKQARSLVDLLGHHPSIVVWCAHNEPLAVDLDPGSDMKLGTLAHLGASMFLPTWNKDVLDRSIVRNISRSDPSRPVVRHSGVLPGVATLGTDTHSYFGWYYGQMHDFAPALKVFPRLAKFVTEFGAQAVPETDEFMHAGDWPDLDWATLFAKHCLQTNNLDRYVPRDECKTYDEWKQATQDYQAALLQLQIEDLRRLKYVPTGGFCQFSFADANPAVSWSVLDHERVPKRGYAALRDACRPVLGMLEPRDGLVHVVSELREVLRGAEVAVDVDGKVWRFAGDVDADSVTFVGRVDVADASTALVVVEHPQTGRVENRYGPLLLRPR